LQQTVGELPAQRIASHHYPTTCVGDARASDGIEICTAAEQCLNKLGIAQSSRCHERSKVVTAATGNGVGFQF
jgi:hypothetical protein